MKPSFRIEQVENLLTAYSHDIRRNGMDDLAIWQALTTYYERPEEWEIEWTSTREEAFDRMVKDNFFAKWNDDFYGIDYETTDEMVLKYLKESQLVKDVSDENADA